MDDDKVGYGKPPRRSQFKPGQSGNPNGRPRRSPDAIDKLISEGLNAPVSYHEGGRRKRAPRYELTWKAMVMAAASGDLDAAAGVLQALKAAKRAGTVGPSIISVTGWLPVIDGLSENGDQDLPAEAEP